jgi:hypothetical protein
MQGRQVSLQLPGTLPRPTLRVPSVQGLDRQSSAFIRRLNGPTRRAQPGFCCKAVAEAARPPANESRPQLQVPGEGLDQVKRRVFLKGQYYR